MAAAVTVVGRAAGATAPDRMLKHEIVQAAAPFNMPSIAIPDFSGRPRFNITAYGAAPDDQEATSVAIARAITAAHAVGGGVVIVPAGVWPTRAVHFKSLVNLHLENDAVLLFSGNPDDYLPAVATSWEGIECFNYSPLIYAYGCHDIAITGQGKLQAKLDVWAKWYARPKAHMDALVKLYNQARRRVPVGRRQMAVGKNHLRPQFIQFNRCRNVLVEDVTIEDSPFWVLHPLLCREVVIRRVKIRALGHNNDGVDPEMSQSVLIEDCVFDQGDDAISVKSGRDMDAWRLNRPSRDIVMRNCRVRNGHQLMAIGSELSGGIENVYVDNCHFDHDGSDRPSAIQNLLYIKTNERRGGYVRNIFMSNVSATKIAGSIVCIETDVLYQWKTLTPTYVRRLTTIEGVHASDITVGEAQRLCSATGETELPIKDVTLTRVHADRVLDRPVMIEHVIGFVNRA